MTGFRPFSIVPVIDLKGGPRRARERRRPRPLRADRHPARRDVRAVAVAAGPARAPGRRRASTSPTSTPSQGRRASRRRRRASFKRPGSNSGSMPASADGPAPRPPRERSAVSSARRARRRAVLLSALGPDAILSLDFQRRVACSALRRSKTIRSLWPPDVIVMTLARVGTGTGPDLARLTAARSAAPDRHGLRGRRPAGHADLAALARSALRACSSRPPFTTGGRRRAARLKRGSAGGRGAATPFWPSVQRPRTRRLPTAEADLSTEVPEGSSCPGWPPV